MNQAIIFDAHETVKRLKAAGFNEEQAEVQTRIISELVNDQLATKRDLQELELRLTHALTLRLGGIMIAAVAVVATLVKIMGH